MRLSKVVFIFWLLCVPQTVFPQPPDNYLQAAALFKAAGQMDKAIAVLSQARHDFGDERIDQFLAQLYLLNGQPEQSLGLLTAQTSKDWLDYLYLGLASEERGDTQAALSYYQHSVDLQPTTVSLFRTAKIYRNKKNYEQAVYFFSRVLEFDSSVRLAHYYLGDCLLQNGQKEKAYTALAKAAVFYPDSLLVSRRLAAVKQALGDDFFRQRKEQKEEERKAVRLPSYTPQEGIALVRVGLATDITEFSFSCASGFMFADTKSSFSGRKERFYTVSLLGGTIVVKDYETKRELARFETPLYIRGAVDEKKTGAFYVLDITYGKNMFWHKQIDRIYRGTLEVRIRNTKINLINHVSIEEYLQGVLAAEIPARSPVQALRAQAVAARTLAYRNRNRHKNQDFDFCADVHCQVYHGLSAETQETNKAVLDTRGLIMAYQGKPIETFYHANSGGCLARDVFGVKEYLETKIDALDGCMPVSSYEQERWFVTYPETFSTAGKDSSFRWQRVYDSEDFSVIFGTSLADVRAINTTHYGDCFHSTAVELKTTSGIKRLEGDLAIRNYFDSLRSSAFRVELQLSSDKKPSRLFFWGAGFGHGTGMSQEGAIAMAEAGYDYRAILKHYYPGTELDEAY